MAKQATTGPREYVRFSPLDRIEHFLLFTSFTVLVITGIPQKFLPAPWADFMIEAMGGIETVRIIHRIAATVMIVESLFHVITTAYKLFVRRAGLPMLPTLRDFLDFLDAVRYNLGLSRKHPYYDRYSFEEKLEYWAVVWGTIVMVVTGFMLWNPISTTRFLPGSFIPAAKAAHGGEALLAFLAIVIWHLYNVHIKTFNKSIFTGKLTNEQMLHEHPKEKDRIDAGLSRPEAPREAIRRRRRVFLPLAAVFLIVTFVALYFFLTFEQTAIATIPPPSAEVEVYVPATPTPLPSSANELRAVLERGKAGPIPHEITGRENCLSCHGLGALYPFSPLHAELRLANDTCQGCHALAPNTTPLPSLEPAPSFSTDLLPVLQRRCVACHNATDNLNLTSYQTLLRGDSKGPVFFPGDAVHSRLITLHNRPSTEHPTRLTDDELVQLRTWIEAGAPNN